MSFLTTQSLHNSKSDIYFLIIVLNLSLYLVQDSSHLIHLVFNKHLVNGNTYLWDTETNCVVHVSQHVSEWQAKPPLSASVRTRQLLQPHTHNTSINLSFSYTNICSVMSRNVSLSSLIDSCLASLVLTKMWLNATIFNKKVSFHISMQHFSLWSTQPQRRGHAHSFKKRISCHSNCHSFIPRAHFHFTSMVKQKYVIIGVFYCPPDISDTYSSQFRSVLNEVCMLFRNLTLIIYTDFNLPIINWTTEPVVAAHAEVHNFLHACPDFTLSQLVTLQTCSSCTSANILYLILRGTPLICTDITHLDGLSVHTVIAGLLNFTLTKKNNTTKQIRCYNRTNFIWINLELVTFTDTFMDTYSTRAIEENWVMFRGTFANLIKMFVPVSIRCNNATPWFNKAPQ